MLTALKKHIKAGNRHPLIEVGWMDASAAPDEQAHAQEDFGALVAITSGGFYVSASSEKVVLATDHWPESGVVRGSVTIPTGWIVYIRIGDEIIKNRIFRKYAHLFGLDGPIPESPMVPAETERQVKVNAS